VFGRIGSRCQFNKSQFRAIELRTKFHQKTTHKNSIGYYGQDSWIGKSLKEKESYLKKCILHFLSLLCNLRLTPINKIGPRKHKATPSEKKSPYTLDIHVDKDRLNLKVGIMYLYFEFLITFGEYGIYR
jgi:hypothetical protein